MRRSRKGTGPQFLKMGNMTVAPTDRKAFWRTLEPGDKIAIIALVVAFLSIILGTYQVYQADRSVHTNVKPLLDLETKDSPDLNNIRLQNYGLGPAVITDVQFLKNEISSKDVTTFIHLPYSVEYRYYLIKEFPSYIQKEEEVMLAEIDLNALKGKGYTKTQIREISEAWEESIIGVRIEIAYEDVLGEKQESLNRKLY